ncbi:MAG: glycosyltransferase family 4 protein [Gammaproteobacteria bacterium]|nr:glycosyltransferase family 4 protein [Gammaproteobacteria bacterium]
MQFVFTAPRFHTNQHYPAKALLDAGHKVTFLVLRRAQSETYAALSPVILGCSPTFDVLRRAAAVLPWVGYTNVGGVPPLSRFFTAMRRTQPSAVVVRDPKSAYGLLAAIAAKLIGAKLILYTQTAKHQPVGRRKRLIYSLMMRTTGAEWFTPILGRPDQYAAVNQGLRYLPFVAEPATSPSSKRWFRNDTVNILSIGKFQRRKRHDLFVDAMAAVAGKHAVRALIVGECTTAEHRQVIQEVARQRARLGLEETVEIRTNLPFGEVQRLYAAHDLFVLPSQGEPAAVSPLEAMAHSLPVICSDTNGTACYIRPGRNGFVFRSGDAQHLAACIAEAIQDRDRLMERGAESYRQVLNEHQPARYVNALVDMARRP